MGEHRAPRLLAITTHLSTRGFNYRARVFLPYLARYFRILAVEFSPLSSCSHLLRKGMLLNYYYLSGIPVIQLCSPFPHDVGQSFFNMLGHSVLRIAGIVDSFNADYLLVSPLYLAASIFIGGTRGVRLTVYEDVDRFYEFYREPFRTLVRVFEHAVLSRADIVVSVSPRLYTEASRLRRGKKTCFIPNGVEYRKLEKYYLMHRAWANTASLVYVGSIEEWTGLHIVVDALSILAKRGTRVKFTVIGPLSSPYASRLLSRARRLGLLGTRIVFTGTMPHEEALRLLSRHGYGVAFFPKTRLLEDGVPLKLLEYAAIGLPLLTTTTTLVGKMAQRTGAGIVLDPSTDPDTLADVLEEILGKNNNEYWGMSMAARRLAKIFDIEELARKEAECIMDTEDSQ